ncbi:Site-specific DNA recombinase [Malonomonas rubra DSM 5091]|uniref:Site-specific DNA recombinase n=1 Tax=Malonomonas rubra DSM 5091 TaxID=1122189 RepID=A0A1M6H1W7_MALRU|nr:recombinase family protein [Malonomonas rubra]SHJ16177.1 Site-specific DNA recombinase [Malonomonas rubra DSM 5091]
MAIIGYARVSTADQQLDVQIEQLQTAGCEKIYREKVSGADISRPQLSALLDYAREGDTVVCCKLDRIARSTKHLLEVVDHLQQKNIAFRALNINLDTTTPTGKLMLTMLGAIAEFERELMLERQREGIAKAKAAGKYKGRKPTVLAQTKRIVELAEQGKKKTEIAAELNVGLSSVYRILSAEIKP